jgi:hypothetical protein
MQPMKVPIPDASASVVVERPVEMVSAYFLEQSNARNWVPWPALKSLEWKTDPPLRVGSAMDCTWYRDDGAGPYFASWVVAELVPAERLVLRHRFPSVWQYTYEWTGESSDATRLTLRSGTGRREGGRIAVATDARLRWIAERALRSVLRRVKPVVEAATAAP